MDTALIISAVTLFKTFLANTFTSLRLRPQTRKGAIADIISVKLTLSIFIGHGLGIVSNALVRRRK